MKKILMFLAMFTLYWPSTNKPIEQYQKVRITGGEFAGKKGMVNFTWADGSVDVLYVSVFHPLGVHYYVTDYHWLELQ